jgi:uridine kinase
MSASQRERIVKQCYFPELIDTSKLSSCQRIIIDGDDGSGKTPLAHKIAHTLGAKVISLDEYLHEDGRPYCDQIKFETLQRDIFSSDKTVIIEGVCMLKILAKISVSYDHHIFTRRFVCGKSAYEEYLDERIPLPKSKLARDIVQYYREFKPFDKCNEIQMLYIDVD